MKYRVERLTNGPKGNPQFAGFAVVDEQGRIKIGAHGRKEIYPRAGTARLSADFYNRKEQGR